MLFVEPPADVLFDITQRRRPELPRFRRLAADGRLIAFRPLKALPRRLGPPADALLLWQLRLAVRRIGFERPVLWINDVTYAPLIEQTGWPSLYDVTDDWLLAPSPPRELERLRRLDALALAHADEVVVCSPALAKSRGTDASGHACSERRRCRPLPATTAATAGPARSAHGCLRRVAARRPSRRRARSRARGRAASIERRPGRARFARLRIAVSAGDAVRTCLCSVPDPTRTSRHTFSTPTSIIVPHRVSPFTESLDPIKAYECLAITTPTVATPVAGFREHADALHVVGRENFTERVAEVVSFSPDRDNRVEPVDWDTRSRAFERVLLSAARRDRSER